MGVIEDWVDVARRARSAGERRNGGDRALPVRPAEIKDGRRWIGELAGRNEVHRLDRVKADVAKVKVAGLAIETGTKWVPHPQCNDANSRARAWGAGGHRKRVRKIDFKKFAVWRRWAFDQRFVEPGVVGLRAT